MLKLLINYINIKIKILTPLIHTFSPHFFLNQKLALNSNHHHPKKPPTMSQQNSTSIPIIKQEYEQTAVDDVLIFEFIWIFKVMANTVYVLTLFYKYSYKFQTFMKVVLLSFEIFLIAGLVNNSVSLYFINEA